MLVVTNTTNIDSVTLIVREKRKSTIPRHNYNQNQPHIINLTCFLLEPPWKTAVTVIKTSHREIQQPTDSHSQLITTNS